MFVITLNSIVANQDSNSEQDSEEEAEVAVYAETAEVAVDDETRSSRAQKEDVKIQMVCKTHLKIYPRRKTDKVIRDYNLFKLWVTHVNQLHKNSVRIMAFKKVFRCWGANARSGVVTKGAPVLSQGSVASQTVPATKNAA